MTAPEAAAGDPAPDVDVDLNLDPDLDPNPGLGLASALGAPVSITACPNGPLLVRGVFDILTPQGNVIPPRRKTVALCRCGMSMLKPFCDGSHRAINFTTEAEPPAPQPQIPA